MVQYSRGISLIELVTVVVIMSITMMLALPNLSEWRIKHRINSEFKQLARVIRTARDQAIYQNHTVTVCPLTQTNECGRDWQEGFVAFVDLNRDLVFDSDEPLIQARDAFPEQDTIFWRAFRNRSYLQMTPLGYTAFQNGTFTYCPKEGLEYARGLILNAAGRLRYTDDEDGDGIDEGANGQPLRCD